MLRRRCGGRAHAQQKTERRGLDFGEGGAAHTSWRPTSICFASGSAGSARCGRGRLLPFPSPARFSLPGLPLSVSAPKPRRAAQPPPPRPSPRPPGSASRSRPRLPFLAGRLLCLVGSPPPPPRCPDCLSLLPSEDVLLPAQPQPAQGAARFHQSPRVGKCSPRRRGRELCFCFRSRSGPASALGE